jgi:hypothetical protein
MSRELTTILKQIQEYEYPIVFISIGSAALMKQNGVLESKYNHQYPPCIQKLESLNRPIFIILIDPVLEDPPYILSIHETDHDIKHNSKYNNLHVHPIRSNVTYMGAPYYQQNNKYEDDITECFVMLNELSQQNKWLSVVHDFSGRDINILTHLFNIRSNNIIYGIDMGENDGCYINLDSRIYDITFNNIVFNPYNTTLEELEVFVQTDDIIKTKMNMYLKSFFDFFSKYVLTVFRQLHVICFCNKQIALNPLEYIYLQTKYKIPIDSLIQEHKYTELYNEIKMCFDVEFNLYFAKFNIDIKNIKHIISNCDPYNWHDKILLYLYYTPYYIKQSSLLS